MAVKTLRTSASPLELHDLVSELELLTDVEHPNVIRLLGACTDPQGPLYVLLEYCSLGSLRGYLHRCRWTDQDQAPQDDKLVDDKAEPPPGMTPRRIIGFAWQIAKGMDYLGQLKVRHVTGRLQSMLVDSMRAGYCSSDVYYRNRSFPACSQRPCFEEHPPKREPRL